MRPIKYVLLAALSIAGCGPVRIDTPDLLVRGVPTDPIECIAARNTQRLSGNPTNVANPTIRLPANCIQKDKVEIVRGGEEAGGTRYLPDNLPLQSEWKYNKHAKNEPPKLCLALSGGGVRSASFSLGVLSALAHSKSAISLENLDVVSSVSGGGYAAAWLIKQHYNRRNDTFVTTDLFPPPDSSVSPTQAAPKSTPYFDHILANSAIMSKTEYGGGIALSLMMIPANLLVNGVFGNHANTTPARRYYEYKLLKTFGADPIATDSTVDDLSFPALAKYYDDNLGRPNNARPPYFVINTTSLLEDSIRHVGAPLANTVFDLTILQYGSDALGRFEYPTVAKKKRDNGLDADDPMHFFRAIATSGAALDGTAVVTGSLQRVLFSNLNIDLGYYIRNPSIPAHARDGHTIIPFPAYFFHHYTRDVYGEKIYLTDGGHSENLGVFSLVRRLCEEIVVVDAEYDPAYEFESYYLLKRALRDEMHLTLEVPGIENNPETSADKLSGSSIRQSDADVPADAAPKKGEVNPRDECSRAVLNEAQSVLPRKGGNIRSCQNSLRWTQYAQTPVLDGTICCTPYMDSNGQLRRLESKIHYIKLAFHSKKCEDSEALESDFLLAYYCKQKGEEYAFPQDSTLTQNFTPEQMRAYIELGNRVTSAWLTTARQ